MKSIPRQHWLIVSLAGFALFALFFFFLIHYSRQSASMSTPVYFFLVVIIALVSTGFLSGAMRSVAKYNAGYQNRSLYLGGPAVIFFIILSIGIKYKPVEAGAALSVSVLVKGVEDPSIIRQGIANLRVGEYSASKQINSENIASFTGIDPKYRGAEFDLSIAVPGYVNDTAANTFLLSNTESYSNITVHLQKKDELISFRGRVIRLPSRRGIPGAEVEFRGADKVFTADSTGRFSAVLPVKSGSSIRIIVTKDNREIYNSLRTIEDNDFLSIPANTR